MYVIIVSKATQNVYVYEVSNHIILYGTQYQYDYRKDGY